MRTYRLLSLDKADKMNSFITPGNVFLVAITWEVLFLVSKVILHKLTLTQGFILDVQGEDIDKRKKRVNKILQLGPSYAIAGIHAAFLSTRGIKHFIDLSHESPVFQLGKVLTTSVTDEYEHIFNAQESVELSNLIFCGWLCYDILHVCYLFPKIGGLDTLIHHAAFIGASIVTGINAIFFFQFSWLIIGELSSIFLNLRWFLIQTGRGNTNAMKLCNMAFACLFLVTRVVFYGLGLLHMLKHGKDVMAVNASKTLVIFVLVLLIAGYCLNLFWMRSICKIATGRGKKSDEKAV